MRGASRPGCLRLGGLPGLLYYFRPFFAFLLLPSFCQRHGAVPWAAIPKLASCLSMPTPPRERESLGVTLSTVPPLVSGPEPFEGAAIIAEFPDAIGIGLWKTLRAISVDLENHNSETADGVIGLHAAFQALPPAVFRVACEVTAPVEFCIAVSRWAREQRAPATELAFAQAAALQAPNDPRLAQAVGRLARDQAEFVRAESWFRRAISLARARDWEVYALAHLSLANLYIEVGNLPTARGWARRALAASTRHRIPAYPGLAHHALFIIAAESGDPGAATRSAGEALRAYGPTHPRLPYLAHDVACFWANQGRFGRALPVFEALLPHLDGPDDRPMVVANIARAIANVGDVAGFDRASTEAELLLAGCKRVGRRVDVHLSLARGYAAASSWREANRHADAALSEAHKSGLHRERREAEVLLQSIASERQCEAKALETLFIRSTADELAQEFVLQLGPEAP